MSAEKENRMKKIQIENQTIGPGELVFIIAEIGYNYTTIEQALATVDAAVECGVDAVKFQTFRAETIVTRDIEFPHEAGGGNQFDEFKEYELSAEHHKQLFTYAREKGVIPFSTPSHATDLPLLQELNASVYKLGADDLTNIPFQIDVAGLGRPMFISTGMGYLSEVAETVEAIHAVGNDQLVVMHCLSNYPIHDLSELNLRTLQTMRQSLGVIIGFSDHTTTLSAPAAAVALGALVYERHFTLDKNIPAPDCALSADPAEMKAIVSMIRETEAMMGNGIKRPASSEMDMRKKTRKSLVANCSLKKGDRLAAENVIIKRPGHGIDPRQLSIALGRRTAQDIPADTVITWEMIQ